MKVFNHNLRTVLGSFMCSWLIATPVWADDTEIYFGGSAKVTVKPNVLFILDTSGSMKEKDGGNISRMDRMKQALTNVLNNAEDINVGLMRFTNPGGPVLYPMRDIDQVVSGGGGSSLATGSVDVRVNSGDDDATQLADGSMRVDANLLQILNPGSTTSITRTVSHSNDDAEQPLGGAAHLDSTDLEFMYEGSTEQVVGVRFRNVDIPKGATITNAYLTFTVKQQYGGDLDVRIWGHDTNNAGVFKNVKKGNTLNNNLTGRNKTSAKVNWAISTSDNPSAGNQMQTPDISSIVQEIVNRGGWSANNKMAFIIDKVSGSSSDKRQFHSYDSTSNTNQRPKLYVEYSTGSGAGQAQKIGLRFNDITVPQGATITSAKLKLTGGASNAESATLTFWGERVGQSEAFESGSNNISNRTRTTASVGWTGTPGFSESSTYTSPELKTIAQEIVNLSGWCGGNSMTFFVEGNAQRVIRAFEDDVDTAAELEISYDTDSVGADACIYQKYSFNIASYSDDAEQNGSSMDLDSSDLDLGEKKVGLRYTNIPLAKNSTISNAYIEFTADGSDSEATNLTIKGHKTANPSTFNTGSNNISNRSKTSASISWTPDTWNSAGETNQTPNIASVINELTAQTDWASGNSLALIIEGSGKRDSESYDGSNLAPRLVIYAKPSDVTAAAGTVRSEMIQAVQGLPNDGWTPIVDTLYEAARYYRGEALEYGDSRGDGGNKHLKRISHPDSYTGGTVIRPDGCSAENPGSSDCAGEYIDGSPIYTSPITESCQANYIVLLTDGFANNNHSETKIKNMTGDTSCVGNDSDEECGIELAKFLHTVDQTNALSQDQTVKTFTVGLEFETTWLTDLAEAGGGSFYRAESANELTSAFDTIIKSIKAANTTFVEPSVTINQFNRFAHRDDVYFALFKPMETAKWFGNLKKYQLKGNPATLYDNQNPQEPAIDPSTGFFAIDSQSFWSEDEDGNQVEKGGAASKLPTTRKIYTLVDSTKALTADDNKVHETNSLITAGMLNVADKNADYRTDLLKWTRGLDENDAPRYELGDPLHSRPELVTYAGLTDPIESTIFFGTNEGFIHAVDINTGIEQFAFIPQELLGNLDTYYTNASVDPRPYGMDGGITLWTRDHNKDGDLKDTGDFTYLYAGMRRGGRNYYALDVTNVNTPTFKWQISGGNGDFVDLGQTWSQPVKSKIKLGGTLYDVLIFGGGYDTNQDNVSVRTADSIGNAIYIVNANTGALIWSAGNHNGHDESHADMDYSIPSKVNVIDMNRDGMADQLYVGDMGGQIWRVDLDNTATQLQNFGYITKIADLAGSYDSNGGAIAAQSADNRRFYYPPDLALAVEGSDRYLTLAIGSGYRAHPLNTAIEDRFYMIKLFDTHTKPSSWTTLTESDLYDATNNYISEGDATQKNEAAVALSNHDVARKDGWMIRMTNTGEKVLSGSATIQNQIVFTTYEPTPPNSGSCNPAQGTSRAYLVSLFDATPMLDINGDGNTNAADRVIQLQIGSIPATPTVIDTLESKPTVWVGPERLDQVNTDVESVRTYWIEVNE
ncbi:PilC/PilY family type IV pilus protein [Motiliproteus sp.]|uniref:PilC/PilY family type IV pilus protein n=1 Tax=Motiliproteus sp. TaxID=1898955 RepID=UPI003BABC3EB